MEKELIDLRLKLRDDFPFYAEHCLKIRTKAATIEPFKLNWAQIRLNEVIEQQLRTTGKVRIIILKARQLGLSTAVGGYLYNRTSQFEAQKTLVATHLSDSTKALFDMTKRYHDLCPDAMKPSTKNNSSRELNFDKLDSQYMVATAGGKGVGRGETITQCHLSELAFWPVAHARANFNGIMQVVPDLPNTSIFIESTANGMTGVFYDQWRQAVEGKNGFYPLFLPWYLHPDYEVEPPEDFEPTPEEEELLAKYPEMTYPKLMFRRQRIAQNGLDLFKQEYPSEPEEAFLTTGRPVFDSAAVMELLKNAPDIIRRESLFQEEWGEDPRGELCIYKEHDPGEQYYIGADVAMGTRDGDYSVAQVLDGKKREVAVWRGHVHPDYFATVLYHLGEKYNWARIAPEVNNHGILTCTRLAKDLAYPNFFLNEIKDKEDDQFTNQLGFQTNVKTKPLIIDELRAALREGSIEIYDKTTLREMLTYVVTETGKLEADEGCHDDTVMSLAIANHIHEGIWEPIPVKQDWLRAAI